MRSLASGINYFVAHAKAERAQRRLRRSERDDVKESLEKLEREELGEAASNVVDPEEHERGLRELASAEGLLDDDSTLVGEAMISGGLEYFERLSRNFAQLDRSAERWLRQLRREQEARGKKVAKTPVVEIDCTVRRDDENGRD